MTRKTRLPGLSAPNNIDPSLRAVIDSIIQHLQVGRGIGSDTLERFVTKRDLSDAGYYSSNGTLVSPGVSTSGQSTTIINNVTGSEPDLTPPPAPTGLAASGAIGSIILTWDDPLSAYGNHAFTEIWRASVDNIGVAVKQGTTGSFIYTDSVGTNATYYYWIRFVSEADVTGEYNAVAGTLGQTGFILPAHIADLAITASKIADGSIDLGGGKITGLLSDLNLAQITDSTKIADSLIGNTKLALAAVTALKIADGSIDLGGAKITGLLGNINLAQITDATKIADSLIGNTKLAALAVDSAKLASSAVTSTKIGNLAVGTAAIQTLAVTTALIASAAVGSAQIANAAITSAKIGTAAVDTAAINTAAITTALIANAAIGSAQIASAAITSAKILDAAVGNAAIANLAVQTTNIADGAIVNAKLGTAAVDSAKIADAAITTAKIGDAQITNAKIGSTIQSTTFTGSNGWKIDKNGKIELNGDGGIVIRNKVGDIILSSGGNDRYNHNNLIVDGSFHLSVDSVWDYWDNGPTWGATIGYNGKPGMRLDCGFFKTFNQKTKIAVLPGERLFFKGKVFATGLVTSSDTTASFRIYSYTEAGAVIEYAYMASKEYTLGAGQNTWDELFAFYDVPENASYIIFYCQLANPAGNTNGHAVFSDLYLSSSPIGQITPSTASTYIADLSVDTLQIAGNAVTVPAYAVDTTDRNFGQTAYVTATWYEVVSISGFDSSASGSTYPVLVEFTCRAENQGGAAAESQGFRLRIKMDGVEQKYVTNFIWFSYVGSDKIQSFYSYVYEMTPPTGAHTFSVELLHYRSDTSLSHSIYVNECSLRLTGVRK